MPHHPSRRLPGCSATIIAALLVLLTAACGDPAECRSVPLTDEAARDLEASAATLDFRPQLPCAFGSGYRVTAVYLDTLPEDPPQPRISIEVARRGSRVYLLSHTRAEVRSSAIPLSSHHLRVVLDDDPTVEAAGFAGPAGTGEDIAYLRWRRNDVTTELLATLSPTFTEADVTRIARALMAAVP